MLRIVILKGLHICYLTIVARENDPTLVLPSTKRCFRCTYTSLISRTFIFQIKNLKESCVLGRDERVILVVRINA